MLAVKNDDEIAALFKNVTIAEGGVKPHIHSQLLVIPSKGKGRKTTTQTTDETDLKPTMPTQKSRKKAVEEQPGDSISQAGRCRGYQSLFQRELKGRIGFELA
jgi:hypothetical protein